MLAPLRRLRQALSSLDAMMLVFALILTTALLGPYLSVVPFYDGDWNWRLLQGAVKKPFSLSNYGMAHVSLSFYLPLGLGERLFPENAVVPHLVSLTFWWAAIIGFGVALSELLPGAERRVLRALGLLLFAVNPTLLAYVVDYVPDSAQVCLYWVFVALLLKRRYRLAGLAALAACFTRQTGAAIVLITTLAYVSIYLLRPAADRRERLAALRPLWPLLIAFVTYGLYYPFFYSRDPLKHTTARYLKGMGNPSFLELALNLDFSAHKLKRMLGAIFLVNCNWVMLLPIIAVGTMKGAELAGLGRWSLRPIVGGRATALLIVLVLMTLYVTTRVKTWNNPRYVIMNYPLLIVAALMAVDALPIPRWLGSTFLAAMLALSLVSVQRTIDPLGRAYFGTLPFGSRELLMIEAPKTTMLDQVKYNLEYMRLSELLDDALARIRPDTSTMFLGGRSSCSHLPLNLDPETFARTARTTERTFQPSRKCRDYKLLLSPRADVRYVYLDFPNLHDAEYLAVVRGALVTTGTWTADRDGYALPYFELRAPASNGSGR